MVAYRARLNYLRNNSRFPEKVPLDEDMKERLPAATLPQIYDGSDEFDFEEERLALAFSKLPDKKKQILVHLFVLEERPDEVARKLGCKVENVYNQRSLALKRLRDALKAGDNHD